jgi:hypothetical protein
MYTAKKMLIVGSSPASSYTGHLSEFCSGNRTGYIARTHKAHFGGTKRSDPVKTTFLVIATNFYPLPTFVLVGSVLIGSTLLADTGFLLFNVYYFA